MNNWRHRGFTIVEILITIIVIAILATISIVAYNGFQERAYNARRISDIKTIEKALKLYRTKFGHYPVSNVNDDWLNWSPTRADSFLDDLVKEGILDKVPTDPKPKSSRLYRYHRYNVGELGCDPDKGPHFILQIVDYELAEKSPDSPGFSCTGRNWNNDAGAWYTIGGYTNP